MALMGPELRRATHVVTSGYIFTRRSLEMSRSLVSNTLMDATINSFGLLNLLRTSQFYVHSADRSLHTSSSSKEDDIRTRMFTSRTSYIGGERRLHGTIMLGRENERDRFSMLL